MDRWNLLWDWIYNDGDKIGVLLEYQLKNILSIDLCDIGNSKLHDICNDKTLCVCEIIVVLDL